VLVAAAVKGGTALRHKGTRQGSIGSQQQQMPVGTSHLCTTIPTLHDRLLFETPSCDKIYTWHGPGLATQYGACCTRLFSVQGAHSAAVRLHLSRGMPMLHVMGMAGGMLFSALFTMGWRRPLPSK
jgi:hypothetical protein